MLQVCPVIQQELDSRLLSCMGKLVLVQGSSDSLQKQGEYLRRSVACQRGKYKRRAFTVLPEKRLEAGTHLEESKSASLFLRQLSFLLLVQHHSFAWCCTEEGGGDKLRFPRNMQRKIQQKGNHGGDGEDKGKGDECASSSVPWSNHFQNVSCGSVLKVVLFSLLPIRKKCFKLSGHCRRIKEIPHLPKYVLYTFPSLC